MIGMLALLGMPLSPWQVLQTSNLALNSRCVLGSGMFSAALACAASAAITTRAPITVCVRMNSLPHLRIVANYSPRNLAALSPSADRAITISAGRASRAIGAASFLRPIHGPCPRRHDSDARDQVGGEFLQCFFCGHARVCGQPGALATQCNAACAHHRSPGGQTVESGLRVSQHAGLGLEPWVLDGGTFRFRVDDLESFANFIFRPNHAVEGIGQALVTEDHDGRRRLVRRDEVVYEAERKSFVDAVDVKDLLMAALERPGPIPAVRWSLLGVRRGCCKAEQAERRHRGDAEKAAAGCTIGRMLIDIAHLLLPRVPYARRCVVVRCRRFHSAKIAHAPARNLPLP